MISSCFLFTAEEFTVSINEEINLSELPKRIDVFRHSEKIGELNLSTQKIKFSRKIQSCCVLKLQKSLFTEFYAVIHCPDNGSKTCQTYQLEPNDPDLMDFLKPHKDSLRKHIFDQFGIEVREGVKYLKDREGFLGCERCYKSAAQSDLLKIQDFIELENSKQKRLFIRDLHISTNASEIFNTWKKTNRLKLKDHYAEYDLEIEPNMAETYVNSFYKNWKTSEQTPLHALIIEVEELIDTKRNHLDIKRYKVKGNVTSLFKCTKH